MLEEEGICDIRIARECFDAFQIAAVVWDKARAKVFAEYVVHKVFSGYDNPPTIAFKHFAQQPVDSPLYGKEFGYSDDNYPERNWRTGSGIRTDGRVEGKGLGRHLNTR